jgi:hypothetical protein
MRTRDGTSPQVSGGDVAFSALGFMGIYLRRGHNSQARVVSPLQAPAPRWEERKEEDTTTELAAVLKD